MLATLLAVGTAQAAPPGAVAQIDKTAARVGDAVIWESDVGLRIKAGAERAAVLEEMIDEELVLAAGKQAGVTVEKSETLAALDEIKQQNSIDDAGLDKALTEAGYTRARYLVDLERQLIRLRTVNQVLTPKVTVSDADVDAEVKKRALPVTTANKETVRTELRREQMNKLTIDWLKTLRSRAYITRTK
jgi:parvulin-like peptidyl-prolyl isomerase